MWCVFCGACACGCGSRVCVWCVCVACVVCVRVVRVCGTYIFRSKSSLCQAVAVTLLLNIKFVLKKLQQQQCNNTINNNKGSNTCCISDVLGKLLLAVLLAVDEDVLEYVVHVSMCALCMCMCCTDGGEIPLENNAARENVLMT